MMEPLMELAAATAAALVEAIAKKETWASARQAVVGLWRHDAKRSVAADVSLDDAESELASAGSGLGDVQTYLTAHWTSQFNTLLRARPEAVDELRELLTLLTPPDADPGAPKPGKLIQQTATASGGGIVTQVGELKGGSGAVSFNFGAGVPAQAPPPAAEG